MRKIVKLILISIAIIVILAISFVIKIIVDIEKQEKLLESEIIKLQQIDLTSQDIEINIITKDEYAIIEKLIKEYLKEYSDNSKEFVNNINDFNFKNMFTAENFRDDGPDFIKSKYMLSNLQTSLNKNLDKLIEMSDSEYIVSLIKEKELDDYYVDIYKSYMFGTDINSFNETIKNNVDEIKEISTNVNSFLDECYGLYDFMSNNRNYWEVKDNTVYFDNDKLVNEYNKLVNRIIEKSNELAEYDDISDNSNYSSSTI